MVGTFETIEALCFNPSLTRKLKSTAAPGGSALTRFRAVFKLLNKLNTKKEPALEEGMIGLRDKEIEERLERLAQKTGRSKSFYVRQALQEFLEDREDYLLGLARLEAGGRRVSLEDAEKELNGLEG